MRSSEHSSCLTVSRMQCILLAGVSGCGKSAVGKSLVQSLGSPWVFIEGDDYHSEKNVEKMSSGEPLIDSDRYPWLVSISSAIRHEISLGRLEIMTSTTFKPKTYLNRIHFSVGFTQKNCRKLFRSEKRV